MPVGLDPVTGGLDKPYATGGVYWTGQDGNLWVKDSRGTNSFGDASQQGAYFDAGVGAGGYNQISDPMANQGGGGGGGGSTYDAAAAQAAAQRAAARQSIMDEKGGYMNSVNDQVGMYGNRYGNSITDYLDKMRAGQSNIDTAAAKNELAKMQGVSGIQGMVGRGIKSTGVMLGNKNAGDSSAAGALSDAYGQLGQRQMANVGNQYELGNMDINNQQTTFDMEKGKGKRDIELGKQEFVTSLMNEAQSTLAGLNAKLVDASLPDRIAIEQEKQGIRDRANAALQQFDANLASGYGGIQASSRDQRMAKANELRSAGTDLGAGAFDFTQEAPMNFQGSAPSGGNLPLFTLPRRRR